MCGKIKVLQPYLLPYSYSLFEPNSRTLAEYGVSLEKAILRDSELLSEVNNAFCNSHPLLAQKVVKRSARAAVSKISADALLAKAISVRRSQAGSLLKTIRKVNAKKLQESDILVGHRFHTAGAERGAHDTPTFEWIIHISLQTNMHMQRYMRDLLPWPMIYMYVKMCAQLILSCLQQL